MIRHGLLVLALIGLLRGQERPAAAAASPPPVLVDTVVATVNDSAIMHSELMTLTAGRVRSLEAAGKRLRPADYDAIYDAELRERIEWHTWAQAAKTFGVMTPGQVENWVQREIERVEQNQVRDLGSYQAFSRALQNKGQTWPTYVREMRVDKMAGIAQDFSIGMRMQRQANLYVTPRMLRDTYENFKARFVHEAQATVALVVFRGADAEANAALAAAQWRSEDLTSRALAKRFPGAVPIDNVAATALVPKLAEFALAGPLDRVSEPIANEGAMQVAKIVAYVPARAGRFEDRDVQDELRDISERQVRAEFAFQALERAKQRTQVWSAKAPR